METKLNLEMPFRFKITIEDLETKGYGTTVVEGVSLESCFNAFVVKAKEVMKNEQSRQ